MKKIKGIKSLLLALPIAAALFCPVKARAAQASQASQAKLEQKLSSCGSLWTENKYDGENLKSRTTVQLGINLLQYKKFTLEPYMEVNAVLNTNRKPWDNTLEVNQGIRLKKGTLQVGVKSVYGFYLPYADTRNIGIELGEHYHEIQPYSSIWHNWKKGNFVGEEWAQLSYTGASTRNMGNDLIFRGTAEAGTIVAKNKGYLIEPFYEIGLDIDTKKLPWNNVVKNSIGIKLKHKGWQLGIEAFNKSYFVKGGDRGERDKGVMLFFKLWGEK